MLKERMLNFIKNFSRFETVGFDISDLSIKYFKFSAKNNFEVEFYGEIVLPPKLIETGIINNEDALVEILREWMKKEGKKLKSKYVVVSLPEEKSFLRLIQIPKIKKEEMANVIRWELEANVPLTPDDLIYDFEVIDVPDLHLDHFDVMITALPRTFTESYVRVLKRAGLYPVAMELESQSIMRSVLPMLKTPGGKIVADIGKTRTSINVFAGNATFYTNTINIGGMVFEECIAKGLNVSPEQALEIKKKIGLHPSAEGGKIYSSLVGPLMTLAEELKRTVFFYQSHTAHLHGEEEAVKEILLVGGDSNLYGIETFLSSELGIPTKVADPLGILLKNSSSPVPSVPHNQSLGYSSAIGLALRNMQNKFSFYA